MAMKPLIIVGCGGSGGKVLVALRNQLEIRLRNSGWTEGIPDAWQLIFIDTPASQENYPDFGPPLPDADYVSVSQGQPVYRHVDTAVMNFLGPDRWKHVAGWRPSPDIALPVDQGAGQWRGVGRIAALSSMKNVSERIRHAMTTISQSGGQLQRLSMHLGDDTAPDDIPFVIIVSSMAGGTGSGIFLDVADVIRGTNTALQNRIIGVLFTAEVFASLGNLAGLQFNTVGAMSELMANYLSPQQPFPAVFKGALNNANSDSMRRGINYPFLVGMKTLNGSVLGSTADAYRSVTETISSICLTPNIQQEFTQYLLNNWTGEQLQHKSRWKMHNRVVGAVGAGGDDVSDNGVVSSFGSARLSVGTQMFAEYAAHRLTRSTMDFMNKEFLRAGRAALSDPGASEEQVLRFYREQQGLQFVENCQLRELNSGNDEYNQVLNQILPDDDLVSGVIAQLRREVENEISEMQQKPAMDFVARIVSAVQARQGSTNAEIAKRITQGSYDFAMNAPQRLLDETSRVMARNGVQVAGAMVQFTREQIEQAIIQLESEIRVNEQYVANVNSYVANEFKEVKEGRGSKLNGDHPFVKSGIRMGTSESAWRGRIETRNAAIALLKKFSIEVISPLMKQLSQIQETGEQQSEISARFPTDEGGVPPRFAPSPLDYCLISQDEWPAKYDELLRETSLRDNEGQLVEPKEHARSAVGGGGFASDSLGSRTAQSAAITLDGHWSVGRPVQFKTQLGVDDILGRARSWIGRSGTPFGDFCSLKMGQYLSPVDATGSPVVDIQRRLDRFQDQLTSSLERTQPLIHVDQQTFVRVHTDGQLNRINTRLVPEPLPLPVGSAAREIAERVIFNFLKGLEEGQQDTSRFFVDDGNDVEGVLYVSRLKGAIHPSAVASLTAPIAQSWVNAQDSDGVDSGAWTYRRTRPLSEFIALRPRVRTDMIQGWIVGRLLGLISKPNENGVQISHETDDHNSTLSSFLWPTLAHGQISKLHDNSKAVLPALLESVGLGYILYATENDALDAYEQLSILGSHAHTVLEHWLRDGVVDATTIAPPVVGGQTIEERKVSIINVLERNKLDYKADMDIKIRTTADLSKLPYGFELTPEIVEIIDHLLSTVNGVQLADTDF
jgi:hypothetical protein